MVTDWDLCCSSHDPIWNGRLVHLLHLERLFGREQLPNLYADVGSMIKVLIGIGIGGSLAMVFPEQATEAFEFIRAGINTFATEVAEGTR